MSFVVRVSGPDFLEEENRKAFLRIEESIRQYSAHSRESIYLTKNPLPLKNDHFTLLWSHGAAVVELLAHSGKIQGGRTGDWITEETQAHSISESNFENPYPEITRARETLIAQLRSRVSIKRPKHTLVQSDASDSLGDPGLLAIDDLGLTGLKAIVIFTLPVREISIDESIRDRNFSAMSLEYATSRTVYHLPNLLRLTDQQSSVYTPAELELSSAHLEKEALRREDASQLERSNPPVIRLKKAASRGVARFRWWWMPLLLIPLIILYMILRPTSRISDPPPIDSIPPAPRSVPVTDVVLILPEEVQLYVSSNLYKTRTDLDIALSHGEGRRILPTSSAITLSLDSLSFAKGVYGYFKADNAWRKGKLLQSFHTADTIRIDNFLPPLE